MPQEISARLRSLADVREIRLRNNRPIRVNVGGQWYTIGTKGLLKSDENGLLLDEECDSIVRRACNNSVYAYEKMLAKGFFTLEDGSRIGVCGQTAGACEMVFRKYTSLCIRIPHRVALVDEQTFEQCQRGNIVVIGPPGSGKTTFLRDLATKLARRYNVLVVDERGEFFYDDNLSNASDCDVLTWCGKSYAFEVGIRAMSPQWIVCDELAIDDKVHLRATLDSGVNIACSVHGNNREEFEDKFGVSAMFTTIVLLDGKHLKPRIITQN